MTILQVRDKYMKSSGDTELKHFGQYCDFLEKKVAELSTQLALKHMESSSRIMSVTEERTYTAKDMHEAFEAGQDYQYSNSIYPDFKKFLAGYAT